MSEANTHNRKRLNCQYLLPHTKHLTVQPSIDLNVAADPIIRSSLLLSNTLSEVLLSHPTNVESILYLRVLRIIRTTGQHIDDIFTRYFRGIHSSIPMLSRSHINRYLVNNSAPPPPGLSVLLLGMCLITYHPDFVPPSADLLDQETLYVATKTLFSLVQASFPPSLHLIQAAMIMATYEYANGKIHNAFASASLCARMGYAACIDSVHPLQEMREEDFLEAETKANTWWSILIWERSGCLLNLDCEKLTRLEISYLKRISNNPYQQSCRTIPPVTATVELLKAEALLLIQRLTVLMPAALHASSRRHIS